jgi:hypothetical protein
MHSSIKFSKAEIARAAGVAMRTVANMRTRFKEMVAAKEQPSGTWWKDRQRNREGDRYDFTEEEMIAKVEALASNLQASLGGPLPSPRMITEAEEALLWLRWLEQDDARIVWLRANRTPWKKICWEVGLSRPAANRHWQYGIAVIVWRLNGRRVPTKRSMEFVIRRAR